MTKTTAKKLDFTNKKMLSAETYSFTVNPNDANQNWTNRLNRFTTVIKKTIRNLDFILSAEYELYPEISKTGRIHYHGYITILDPMEFLLYDIRQLDKWSKYEIDTLTDNDVWPRYIKKDKETVQRYCKSKQLPYKLTNKQGPKAPSPIVEALKITINPLDNCTI